VTNVNGRIKKNGGNVATIFCTPDGRVIHAVGKAVDADQLLEEAEWAVDLWSKVKQSDPATQQAMVEQAHLASLGATSEAYAERVRQELPEAYEQFVRNRERYAAQRDGGSDLRQRMRDLRAPELVARYKAARKFSGDRAHQILAAQPLGEYQSLESELFEKLTGERYNLQRGRVFRAAEGLAAAMESGRPILFVFYKGQGSEKADPDSQTKRLFTETLTQPILAQALQSYVVIAIPLRELSALTTIARLPQYELASSGAPHLVLARPDGTEIATLSGSAAVETLAMHLWPPVTELHLAEAESLIEQEKLSEALRLLRTVAKHPLSPETATDVQRKTDDASLMLANQWAASNRTTTALGLLTRLERESIFPEVQQAAAARVAEIRGR